MKKIIVAGSSSGIGKAITQKLLTDYKVIGLARHHQKFSPDHPHYTPLTIDFSDIDSLERQFKAIQKTEQPIDALVLSVGYGEFAELEQFSVKNMQTMLNVNFLSQVILIKTFLPHFKKQRYGKIILLGSECALEGQKKASIYAATKFALRGFSQSLRKECAAANITVTLINPGLVETPFFENLSFCPKEGDEYAIQPEQIATLVAHIIAEKENCVYEEINLQPLKKAIMMKIESSLGD